MSEELNRRRQAKKAETGKTGIHYHTAPRDFERDYLRQYDLRDHAAMRRVTQTDVLEIRKTHGNPETESNLTGPPKDFSEQVAVMAKRAAERKALLATIHPQTTQLPPPGENLPTQKPWTPLSITPEEAADQERKRYSMISGLMWLANEKGEITPEQYDRFLKDGTVPPID